MDISRAANTTKIFSGRGNFQLKTKQYSSGSLFRCHEPKIYANFRFATKTQKSI